MTLPSKSIESSSLGNSFQSGDRRRDLYPDDLLAPRGLHPDHRGKNEEEAEEEEEAEGVQGDDPLHLQSSATADQPLTQQQHQQQQQHPADEIKTCKVCGDTATGMYFGALVCVPCKTFFLRYAGDGFAYECKSSKNCEVTMGTRTQCKFCRYQKCLRVGMCRRVRPAQVEAQDGQQLCIVCQDVANGVHFGVQTCEGCKKFFRRGLTEQKSYRCRGNQNCCINPSNRNACRYCRFQKCINAGMSREAIQMGRPSKIPVFDGGGHHHQRSQHGKDGGSGGGGGDRSRDLGGSRGPQQPVGGLLRLSATGGVALDYPGGRRPMDGSRAATDRRPNGGALFPSWTAADDGRETLSQRYDLILAAAAAAAAAKKTAPVPVPVPAGGAWPVGCYPPPIVVVPKSGSDEGEAEAEAEGEGEKSDGRRVESSGPFLMGLRAKTTGSSDWNRPRRDFSFSSRKRSSRSSLASGGFQDAVAVKQEARSSEDDDDDDDDDDDYYEEKPSVVVKRIRCNDDDDDDNQGSAAGCTLLPQDRRLQLGRRDISPSSVAAAAAAAERLDAFSAVQTRSRFRFHENPYSAEALEDYIPGPGASAGRPEPAPVQPESSRGSPGVSSSPGRRRVDGPIGSTRGQVAVGREFESRRYDREFSDDRDNSDVAAGTPGGVAAGDVGVTGLLSGDELGPQAEEVGNQCWRTIKQVIPAYHRFVSAGTTINQQLKKAHETWMKENPRSDSPDELSSWIQTAVVPAYTTVSVAYCKCLPDFTDLCVVDQRILIAGGQSQSRILTAALHWYDAGEKKFRNFLSWRTEGPHRADVFKGKLLAFAERVTKLHLDPIEAALLNALGLFNTDYPRLQYRGAIEASREKISTTIKSYVTTNHSAPGDRLECLWQVLKEAQVLGAEHVALTRTSTLGLPSSGENRRAAPVADAEEVEAQADDDTSPVSFGQATGERQDDDDDDDDVPSDHVTLESRDERPSGRTGSANGQTHTGSGLPCGGGGQQIPPNSVVSRSDDDEEEEEVENLLRDPPGPAAV